MKQLDRHEILNTLHYISRNNNDTNSNNSGKCKVRYPVLAFQVANNSIT